MDVAGVAEYLGFSPSTIYEKVQTKDMSPFEKEGLRPARGLAYRIMALFFKSSARDPKPSLKPRLRTESIVNSQNP